MRTGLFIIVAIDVIFITWVLRDLLLWYLKINRKIEIQENVVEKMLWIIEKLKRNINPQENKPKEVFIQEKIRISAKRRIKNAETQSCMMAEVENYAQQVGKYCQMKK